MELEDQNWLAVLSVDKERAFRLLVNMYAKRVYNTCLRLTFNEEDAQDLTQEVFTAVFLSLESYRGDAKLSTWIYSIAINKSKEFIRYKMRDKRNSQHTISLDLFTTSHELESFSSETPLSVMEQKERIGFLMAAINALPENQRIAYTLNKLDGHTYIEVSDAMGISLQSVESLLFRAKQNLRTYLEKKLNT